MTVYHAKYFAHELTKRCASDNRLQLVADAAERIPAPHEGLADNFEELPEIQDEWLEDEDESETPPTATQQFSPGQLRELKEEMATSTKLTE